jgi:hypothetical protein
MLAIYAAEERHITRMCAALSPEQQRVLVTDWTELERNRPRATCTLVAIEWLTTDPVVPRLSSFKTRHPNHPVVLVTRWDPENARHLKDVRVEEVVWFREVDRDLTPAVQRACRHDFHALRCLALPFELATHLPATLRKALAHACRSERAVGSVKHLAAAVGVDRRTLWHQWSKAVCPSSSLRLQDFLHWLLLLRAVGHKVPGQSWASVARELRVHPHTLGRLAKQLTGGTLSGLGDGGDVALLFRERVLDFLVGERPLDIP